MLYEFICLPFGHHLAPRTFATIMKPVQALLRLKGIRVVCYIVDILISGQTFDKCLNNVAAVGDLLQPWVYNKQKEI